MSVRLSDGGMFPTIRECKESANKRVEETGQPRAIFRRRRNGEDSYFHVRFMEIHRRLQNYDEVVYPDQQKGKP